MLPVASSTVRAALAGLSAVGLDAAALVPAAGLASVPLDAPGGAVPVATFAALWRAAADADPDPALPVRAGLAVPVGALPFLEPLVGTAPSLGAALGTLADRLYLATAALQAEATQGPDGYELRFTTHATLPRFEPGEAWAATVALTRLRLAAGTPDPFARVRLPPSVAAARRSAALLGVPVEADPGGTALVLASGAAGRPLRTADAGVRALFEAAADQLGGASLRTDPLASAVGRALPSALAAGAFGVGDVAARLGFSQRSLQRRLADEGTSFTAILDAYRHREARRLLATTDLPLSEVAAALGYAEQAALTRAFGRWEGTSPRRWRQREAPT